MSEGLIKSMWMGLPPGVDDTLDSLLDGVLGPGNSGYDLWEESDEESE